MREKLCIIIRDPESNSSNENPKECSIRKRSKKRTQSKTKSLFSKYRKALKRKDFYYKKTTWLTREEIIWNKNRKVSGENMKDPLLFFKTAYFFQQCTNVECCWYRHGITTFNGARKTFMKFRCRTTPFGSGKTKNSLQ